jgi:hypothetical protein
MKLSLGLWLVAAFLFAGCSEKKVTDATPATHDATSALAESPTNSAVAVATTNSSVDPAIASTPTITNNVGAIGQPLDPNQPPDNTGKTVSKGENVPSSGGAGEVVNGGMSYLQNIATGKQKAIKTVDIAQLNQAIQMFNVEEGRFPRDLKELVRGQYISKIPDPPYRMKIVYDPNSGQVGVVPIDE